MQTKIENLVEQVQQTEGATLSDIERLVQATMQDMQAEVTETILQAQADEENEADKLCPDCGQRMQNIRAEKETDCNYGG